MSTSSRRRRRGDSRTESSGAASPASQSPASSSGAPGPGFLMQMRGWLDALVIAYVLAMFIRTYGVELFKIPTGSMMPTLVGDNAVVEVDYTGNGEKDLVVFYREVLQVWVREGGKYVRQVWVRGVPAEKQRELRLLAKPRYDMILVNKFSYWFGRPKRGDIIVFKVPNRPELEAGNPWNPKTPTFIKRCVGVEDDHVRIEMAAAAIYGPDKEEAISQFPFSAEWHFATGPAHVNGAPLDTPEVFTRIEHFPHGFGPWGSIDDPQEFDVPKGHVFMVGDNASNSADSRAWGPVPVANVKGKAIFRYWPFKKISFLE